MLESLDRIDWSKLTHAYGAATDVPELLRALASPDEDAREHAIYELQGNIWHQGTVYPASAQAVPFLVELLNAPRVLGKDAILILLAHLANGSSYHNVRQHVPRLKSEAASSEAQRRIPVELEWVRAATAAVKAGQEAYVKLLSDNDPGVRAAAVYLLAALNKPAPELANLMAERYAKEKNELVRGALLLGLGWLSDKTEPNRSLLLKALTTETSPATKLGATFGLIRLCPDQVPQAVIATLLEAVWAPDRFKSFEDSPWGQVDGLEKLVTDYLARLEGQPAAVAEQALAEALPGMEHPQALATAEALLNVAFREPTAHDATFASLSEQQRRILTVVAKNRNVWVQTVGGEPAVSVKTSLLMRTCGLPGKLNEFLDYVTREEGTFPQVPAPEKKAGFFERFRNRLHSK